MTRRHLLRLGAFSAAGGPLRVAFGAFAGGSILAFIENRDDLSRGARAALVRAVRVRFGGAALDPETPSRPEIATAKAILASAIALEVSPKRAARAAWEGWRSVLGLVPPPIAVHYEVLKLEGRPPRGRAIDLALSFPDYYSDEIAPDLVAWWLEALRAGRLSDETMRETRAALARTRVKMRPLLLDKLRLLARLDRESRVADGARKAELERTRAAVEAELTRSFDRVSRRPEVLDPGKRPFDRLMLALDDFGVTPTDDDRLLDPDGEPPPPRAVPVPQSKREPGGGARAEPRVEVPLVEPEGPPPLEHLPPQPRPGDPKPFRDPVPKRSLLELIQAYRIQLVRTIEPWLGTPYRLGNDTRGVSTDCSGFTRAVYGEAFGIELPRTSRDQFRCGRSVPRRALRPGDLVFFDTRDDGRINHVGIVLAEGRFVHASRSRGVTYDRLSDRYHARAYRGARRILAFPDRKGRPRSSR